MKKFVCVFIDSDSKSYDFKILLSDDYLSVFDVYPDCFGAIPQDIVFEKYNEMQNSIGEYTERDQENLTRMYILLNT